MDEQVAEILGNIKALIADLEASATTEAPTGDDVEDIAMSDDPGTDEENDNPDETPGEEDTQVEKTIENTDSDGPTAVDDAEDVIDENLTDITDEGVKQVAKAFAPILNVMGYKLQPKKKVVKSETQQVLEAVQSIALTFKKSLDDVNQRMNGQDEAFGNILEGMGIVKQMELQKSQKKTPKAQPIVSTENAATMQFINELQKAMGNETGNSNTVEKSNREKVRDNLGEQTLRAIFK